MIKLTYFGFSTVNQGLLGNDLGVENKFLGFFLDFGLHVNATDQDLENKKI